MAGIYQEQEPSHAPVGAPVSHRFAVSRKLGEGGMGTVYEAVDHERHLRVALKVLRQLEPQSLLRFKGEFRKLQDLHHPNLVSLGELVEEQGQWFFTMELVSGQDFFTSIRTSGPELGPSPTSEDTVPSPAPHEESPTRPERPGAAAAPPRDTSPAHVPGAVDPERLRGALGQLALGLHALHRAGKVHRDIKPSNILITGEGRVVLLDFGILSDVEDDETWDGSVIVGTRAYMAPEQERGAPPSPEADWYSVGVLLYLCLTGRKPGPVLPADPWGPELPADLCSLCEALMQPEPRRRPSGEEVLRRLGVEHTARYEAWGTSQLPFVGREHELRMLHQALADSRQGASVVVRVEGESGVGKSRLVRHFLHEVSQRMPRAVVLHGRCYERESVPYKGVEGVVDGLVRYLQGPGQPVAESVTVRERSLLSRLFPFARALLPEHAHAPEPEGSPLQQRLAALAVLRGVVERLAAQEPLVLCVDDLQWAGPDTVALLEELLQAPGVLLVGTLRRHAENTLPSGARECRWWSGARVLGMEGLRPEDARQLAARLLGKHARRSSEAVSRIVQESQGHPLFIDALVRYQEDGHGGARPRLLNEALWTQVQHLEVSARELLCLLAVADGPLPQDVAAHATSLGPLAYTHVSASLRGAHLIVTTGPGGTDLVEVMHDRVRQALVAKLPATQRQPWHRRLAHALEERGYGRPETLALHWREAGEPQRAAHHCVRAAEEASQSLAFAHAAELYRQALELGQWEASEQRRLRLARAEALGHAGLGREAAEALLSVAAHTPGDEARGLRYQAAEQYLSSGYLDEALATLRRCLEGLGVRYPETARQAVWEQRKQRLALALRSWRTPRPREPHRSTGPQRARLEVLHALASNLSIISFMQAGGFVARYHREALEAGDTLHLCLALSMELTNFTARQPWAHAELQRRVEEIQRLAALHPDEPALQGAISFRLAAKDMLSGRFSGIALHVNEALGHVQGKPGAQWLLAGLGNLTAIAMSLTGELGALRKRFELPVAEAWERRDLLRLASFELGAGTLRWLAADEPEQGRQQADAVVALWSRGGHYVQHFNHLMSEVYVDLYEEHPGQALRRLEEKLPGLDRMGASWMLRSRLVELRARAGLMQALRQEGPERELSLRAVLSGIRWLERLPLDFPRVMAGLLRAGVAAASGQPAASLYGDAARELERAGFLLAAAVARLRQGQHLGGEPSRRQVEEALEWMRQRGIVRPERMAGLVAPGRPAVLR